MGIALSRFAIWNHLMICLSTCQPVLQVNNLRDKVPLEKVANDLHVSRLVEGWRKAIRKAYTLHLQPFIHGTFAPHLPHSALYPA